MVKIKVYLINWREETNTARTAYWGICDCLYNVYLFGFIIYSVTLKGLRRTEAGDMFGKYIQNG